MTGEDISSPHRHDEPIVAAQEKPAPEHAHIEAIKAHDVPQLKSSLDHLSVWQTLLRFKWATLVCILVSFGGSADGYQIGVVNGNILANPGFVKQFGTGVGPDGSQILDTNVVASWGAIQSSGQIIGMIFVTPLSDFVGRKITFYTLWGILALSLILESVSKTWHVWLIAKLFVGIGVGTLQATVAPYICEWSPVNLRGALIMWYSIWFAIGGFFGPVMFQVMSTYAPDNWKTPVYTQWGVMALMLAVFVYLPESPWYYAAKGKDDKGRQVLRRINGGVYDYDVDEQYAIIKNTIIEERITAQNGGEVSTLKAYAQLFKRPDLLRTIASWMPVSCNQLTGLSLLGVYSSYFFKVAGFNNAFAITCILTGLQVGGLILFAIIADHLGRRFLVLTSAVTCTLCVLLIGVLGVVTRNNAINIVTVVLACIWSVFNQLLGALGWVYSAEVASSRLRAKTAGVTSAMGVLWGLTFNTSVPYMLDVNGANLGLRAGFIFFALGTVVTIASFFFVPETAKRSPAELDEMYEKRVPAWRFKKYKTEVEQRLRGHEGDVTSPAHVE